MGGSNLALESNCSVVMESDAEYIVWAVANNKEWSRIKVPVSILICVACNFFVFGFKLFLLAMCIVC